MLMTLGWLCPSCNRVFSPMVSECVYCNEEDTEEEDTDEELSPCIGFMAEAPDDEDEEYDD